MATGAFDLQKLLTDVFEPEAGENVIVMVDMPHGAITDHGDWAERRNMAEDWRLAFEKLGLHVHPLLTYPATGANNGDLPAEGTISNHAVQIASVLHECNIAVAMTEFSATSPLLAIANQVSTLRVASMPGVLRRMEQSALAADYDQIAWKTHILAERLTRAETAEILFSTGHAVTFDLRYRRGHADDGKCTRKKRDPLINLPSGETFIVPYEGELKSTPSLTGGTLPLHYGESIVLLHIVENHIDHIEGMGEDADAIREYFKRDPARTNIAELGLGCNDRAIVAGNVLEDEKAGMHWAYGRSEHLGGTVGPDSFLSPENVVHQDVVCTRGCPVSVHSLLIHYPGGVEEIIRDNEYTIF
ncbi:MAG: hypothetical protein KJ626_04085 [Verrucomicrobia bacterium]|nr:hypothetical protein [Verrucomicrobiota bacterium]